MAEVTPKRTGRKPSRHACPQCGAPVYKDHRHFRDRVISIVREVRRYHCKDCGWQGLLAQSQQTAPKAATRPARSRTVWIVGGVLSIPLLVLWAAVHWMDERAKAMPVAPSLANTATPLQPDTPTKVVAELSGEVRSDCVWGGPGESPYAGSLGAALTAARLPKEIVGKFEIMRTSSLVSDRLEISSAGIRSADGRRQFGHFANAMALGTTLCFTTKINMPPDTITFADLYELIDDMHRRYTIMIVVRGGNVAVLEEQTER